jgi:membrane protein required for colicin V production
MVLDLIGIILILLFFIRGYMKGFIIAAFSLLAILLGIICALKLSHILAKYLFDKGIITSGWGQLISYIILFIGVVLIVRLIAKALETTAKAAMLGWVDKGIGGLLYAFLAAVVWSSILWISNQMHLISPETIAYSKTYKYLSPLAPWVFKHIGALLPFAKNVFGDLQHFFEHVNQKLPDHVGADR